MKISQDEKRNFHVKVQDSSFPFRNYGVKERKKNVGLILTTSSKGRKYKTENS